MSISVLIVLFDFGDEADELPKDFFGVPAVGLIFSRSMNAIKKSVRTVALANTTLILNGVWVCAKSEKDQFVEQEDTLHVL